MAKKRISTVDLSWLILQQMDDGGSRAPHLSLAVIADDKLGWRAVVGVIVGGSLRPRSSANLLMCNEGSDQFMNFSIEYRDRLRAVFPFALLRSTSKADGEPISADCWGDVRLSDIEPRFVCQACGRLSWHDLSNMAGIERRKLPMAADRSR